MVSPPGWPTFFTLSLGFQIPLEGGLYALNPPVLSHRKLAIFQQFNAPNMMQFTLSDTIHGCPLSLTVPKYHGATSTSHVDDCDLGLVISQELLRFISMHFESIDIE